MRNVRRNVDEISRAGFIDKIEIFPPAEAGTAARNVDDGFQLSVMMRAGLSIGMDHHRSSPEFLGADSGMRDGLGAIHARRLRCVGIEFAAADDAEAVVFPIGSVIIS